MRQTSYATNVILSIKVISDICRLYGLSQYQGQRCEAEAWAALSRPALAKAGAGPGSAPTATVTD